MRVLVTGIAGFIGSHVADALIGRGHEVVGIDNLTTGRQSNVPLCYWVEDDVSTIDRFLTPDVILHAAASYKDPEDWVSDAATNATGSAAIARYAVDRGVKRLVYLQTALCYGRFPDIPTTTASPLGPVGSYAISKTAGEQYCFHAQGRGVEVLSFRLANAYGSRNLSGAVPAFWRRLTAGEECSVTPAARDMVFITDLVDLLVAALEGSGRPGVYHAGSGQSVPVIDVYKQVEETVGVSQEVRLVPLGRDEAPDICLDSEDTYTEFGWRPKVGLEEGVRSACEWYERNGVPNTYTHLAVG